MGVEGSGPGHVRTGQPDSHNAHGTSNLSHGLLNTKASQTMMLVCEFAMRVDQHALAFTMLGCCYRVIRLLGLDSTNKTSNAHKTKGVRQIEVERRLLWSCYIMDSFIGGGIDGNLEWKDDVPRVPLPCSDHCFLAQAHHAEQEEELPEPHNPGTPAILGRLNLRCHVIYLARFRTQVLR